MIPYIFLPIRQLYVVDTTDWCRQLALLISTIIWQDSLLEIDWHFFSNILYHFGFLKNHYANYLLYFAIVLWWYHLWKSNIYVWFIIEYIIHNINYLYEYYDSSIISSFKTCFPFHNTLSWLQEKVWTLFPLFKLLVCHLSSFGW